MTKKIISCLIALTLFFTLAVASVSADTVLTIAALDVATDAGADVTVQIAVTASANSISYFAFNGAWDTTKLTYKSYELKNITSDTAVDVNAANGTFVYQTLNDNNTTTEFANTVVLEMTFTAADVTSTTQTAVTITKWDDADEGYVTASYDELPSANVATSNATVTINAAAAPHEAPVIGTLNVTGTGEVGTVLTAAASDITDNLGLEATVAYTWTVDGNVVSNAATYTPAAAAIGKTATVSAVATVEAAENPTSAAKTATIDIIANQTAAASVANVAFNKTAITVDNPVTVTYDFTASVNGGNDASTVAFSDKNGGALAGTINGATYTPAAADVDNGIILVATVTPNGSNDVVTGTPVTIEAAEAVANKAATVTLDSLTATPDEEIEVALTLDGNTGFTNLSLEVDYDTDIFTLVSVTPNDAVGATFTGAEEITVKPYILTWYSASNTTFNGTLATLKFKVKNTVAIGVYDITVDFYKGLNNDNVDGVDVNFDADDADLGLTYVDGEITVKRPGDINNDMSVNNTDAIDFMKYLAKWDVTVNENALDTDANGKVNTKDVVALLRYLAGWVIELN